MAMEKLSKLILALTALVGFIIYLGYHLAYYQKIYPGISVARIPLGNRTSGEASLILKARWEKILAEAKIEIVFDGQKWQINPKDIVLTYDWQGLSEKALMIGRGDDLFANLKLKLQAWSKGIDLPLDYRLNQERLSARLEEIRQQIDQDAVPPTLIIKGEKIAVSGGQIGQKIDQEKLISSLNHQLSYFDFSPLTLPLVTTGTFPTPLQIEETKKRAENLLGKRLVLSLDGEVKSELEDEELIKFLSFFNSYDQAKIVQLTSGLAQNINRPPENAAFQFLEKEKKVREFRPAKEGKTVDQDGAGLAIIQALEKLEAEKEEVKVAIPIFSFPPAITTADVNNLGLSQIIGKGVSYFKGSIPSRIHNIKLAASSLNGLLIAPGETFSFNQAVGEISPATGYKEAYIIKEGRTILGDGGGVCQVSTTLFRAALNAGLPIVERHPHAYRVSYYEQNSPVGLDATVFAPAVDLKIKNNTPAYILIQTSVDLGKKMLVFELYGTADDRQITISKSRIWDQAPPPPDLYQEDPTLPTGTVKQIDWKAWGAKVAFDYRVEKDGQVLEKRTFFSAYRPWQAIYLKGTGGPSPP